MNFIGMLFLSLFMSQYCEGNIAANFAITFEILTPERSFGALMCGVKKHNQTLAVKFDTTTKECTALPDSWFTTRKIIQGNAYYLQTMFEEIFEPTKETGLLDVPGVFSTGAALLVVFNTGELTPTTHTVLQLRAHSPNEFLVLSVGLRHNIPRTSYNTFKDGLFESEERSELLVTKPFTTYRIKIVMMNYEFQISVDGHPSYNFTRRYPDIPGYFRFTSGASICHQVQFFFPV